MGMAEMLDSIAPDVVLDQQDKAETPVETPVSEPEPVAEKPVEPAVETPVEKPEETEKEVEKEHKRSMLDDLREERARRRDMQQRMEQYEQRWNELTKRLSQPQEEPIPDYEADPLGHLKAENDRLRRQVEEVAQWKGQTTEHIAQAQQFQTFQQNVAAMEHEFTAKTPDYGQAVDFLYQRRAAEMKAMGATPQEIQQEISGTAYNLTVRAIKQGMNPAEYTYNIAKQLGYNNQPAPTAKTEKPTAPSSLSSPGGVPDTGMPTMEAISNMSDSEFDAFWDKQMKPKRK